MILVYPQPLLSQNNVLDADYANTKLTAAKAAKVSLADNYIYCYDKLDGERVNIDCEVMEELAHEHASGAWVPIMVGIIQTKCR
jgi:hypothetical protein